MIIRAGQTVFQTFWLLQYVCDAAMAYTWKSKYIYMWRNHFMLLRASLNHDLRWDVTWLQYTHRWYNGVELISECHPHQTSFDINVMRSQCWPPLNESRLLHRIITRVDSGGKKTYDISVIICHVIAMQALQLKQITAPSNICMT